MKILASTVAVLAFVATSVHAYDVSVRSNFVRIQNASGLTDSYADAELAAAIRNVPGYSLTNASATPWQQDFYPGGNLRLLRSGLTDGMGIFTETYTESQVDSFLGPLTNGTWSADFGNGAYSFDTTSVYRTAAQRNYLTLTASSVALWNSIVATNATGIFTFDLTQSAASLGLTDGKAQVFGISDFIGASFAANSTSFTLNIMGAVGQSASLSFGARTEWTQLTPTGSVLYSNYSSTVIGGAVPAPGAIALLGLAGLAGRRRR